MHGRWMPLSVLILAVVALFASIVWVVGGTGMGRSDHSVAPTMSGYGGPMMTGPGGDGSMPGYGAMPLRTPGNGQVRSLDDARRAADQFGQQRRLHTGEVMQFSNGYYAELLDGQGRGATEVLIDPTSGMVQLEMGPAMMWNTTYGMMPNAQPSDRSPVTADQAQRIADQWLSQHRWGLHATDATAFPGYYTLHTLRGDQIVGMMSVNAQTAAVWYHTWHGQFIAMQEAPTAPDMPR